MAFRFRLATFSAILLTSLVVSLVGCEPMESTSARGPSRDYTDFEVPESYDGEFNPDDLRIGNTVGTLAPRLEGTDLQGRPFKLSDYRGRVVLLDFWATWCGPCRAMFGHTRDLDEKFRGKPFSIVAISGDDTAEAARKMMQQEGLAWRCVFSGAKDWSREFEVRYIPTFVVIDQNGVVQLVQGRDEDAPPVDPVTIQARIEELIGE